ncbi:MAG: type I methionyl aminopeptidase [Phycisphaerae bacterium]
MGIRLKSPEEIEKMRRAGRVVGLVLDRLGQMVAPGVTTEDLDAEAERICLEHGGECLFKGVPGRGGAGPFPGNICASINEEVVHGIPSKDRRIEDGQIVSVDFGVRLDGWCGDSARTYMVGEVAAEVRKLVEVTRYSLTIAASMCRPGEMWSNVARAMQEYIEGNGLSVVRDFVGHGIGREMHEDPKVPNFVSRDLENRDILLQEGMVVAVEPMVNLGSSAVEYGPDKWTVLTRDRKPSAHFEHTIAITADGADLLTVGEKAD